MADVEGVAAGDGNLLRHRDPLGLALQQGADGQVIVGAEDAVEVGVARQRLIEQLAAEGKGGGLLGQQVLAGEAEVLHRLVVALHPQLGPHVETGAEIDHLTSAPAQHL